jgi:hypothetical protein
MQGKEPWAVNKRGWESYSCKGEDKGEGYSRGEDYIGNKTVRFRGKVRF